MEDQNLRKVTLNEILTETELNIIVNLFEKNNLTDVRKFLNLEERKNRLEKNGIFPDYLYYQLILMFNKV
jgi:hypothetical protein